MDDPRYKFFQDVYECAVCYLVPRPSERVLLECGHSGCLPCFSASERCPECRTEFAPPLAVTKDYKYEYAYNSLRVDCPDGCDARVFPPALEAHKLECVEALKKRNRFLERRVQELEEERSRTRTVVTVGDDDTDNDDEELPIVLPDVAVAAMARVRGARHLRDDDNDSDDNDAQTRDTDGSFLRGPPGAPPPRRRRRVF